MKEQPKVIEKWKCPNNPRCGKWHKGPDFAEECCRPQDISGYGCSECDAGFEDEYDADQHVTDAHPEELDNFGLPVITKAELEEAGQQRLI